MTELTKYLKSKKIAIILFMVGILLGILSYIMPLRELSIISFVVLLVAVIQFFKTMEG